MSWLIAALFGGVGGRWAHGDSEEGWFRNPPWCLPCIVVLGALSAIIIYMVVGRQLGQLTFVEQALLGFGSGATGVAIIAGGLDAMRGKGSSANR